MVVGVSLLKKYITSLFAAASLRIGFVCLLVAGKTTGQQVAALQKQVEILQPSTLKSSQVVLQTPYDKPIIITPNASNLLNGKEVLRVDLYYSAFQRSDRFNQRRLNDLRWQELEKLYPGISRNEAVLYRELGQTGITSLEQGRQVFHGFVVSTQKRPDSLAYLAEKEELAAFVQKHWPSKKSKAEGKPATPKPSPASNTGGATSPTHLEGGTNRLQEFMQKTYNETAEQKHLCSGTYVMKFTVDTLGKVKSALVAQGVGGKCDAYVLNLLKASPPWVPGLLEGKRSETNLMLPLTIDQNGSRITVGEPIVNNVYVPRKNELPSYAYPPKTPGFERLDTKAEPVVTESLGRIKTNKAVLVVDVTASMSPFLAQTLKWIDKHFARKPFKHAVFFNDGDGNHERRKTAGNAGGLYRCEFTSVEVVQQTLLKACNDGGDQPENNLEALLFAQKICTDCTELVMIADNLATPHDMELLPQLHLPVHIILCRSQYAANPAYLQIAQATGGSVSTKTETVALNTDLSRNPNVKVGNITFTYKNGKFEKVFK